MIPLAIIPKLSLRETIVLWQNCQKQLAPHPVGKKRKRKRKRKLVHQLMESHRADQARQIVAAIDAYWNQLISGEAVNDGYFRWPTTEAPAHGGPFGLADWPTQGPLKVFGYEVAGSSDLSPHVRRQILAGVFVSTIPPLWPKYYVARWGAPSSAERLRAMAESIGAFTRNAKRRRSGWLDTAISKWESDLDHLYTVYYVGKFRFGWPTGELS